MFTLIHDFAPTGENPRNSEGCFYRRNDGKILFFYSRFTGGYNDEATSSIALAVFSPDGKALESDGKILFRTSDFDGAANVMCPSALTLGDGSLALFFLVRMKAGGLNLWRFVSSDGGETFSSGNPCFPSDRYFVTEMERVISLPLGRILAPAGEHTLVNGHPSRRSRTVVFISDDGGASFREGEPLDSGDPLEKCGFQEPGVIKLPDGRVFIYSRTDRGCQYTGFSSDDGESFTPLAPNGVFPSPISPMSVGKLADGRFIAVFNPIPESVSGRTQMWGRSPLVYRLSEDGVNWGEMREIEAETDDASFCYTSIFSDRDFVLLAYSAGTRDDKCCLNRLRVVREELGEIR